MDFDRNEEKSCPFSSVVLTSYERKHLQLSLVSSNAIIFLRGRLIPKTCWHSHLLSMLLLSLTQGKQVRSLSFHYTQYIITNKLISCYLCYSKMQQIFLLAQKWIIFKTLQGAIHIDVTDNQQDLYSLENSLLKQLLYYITLKEISSIGWVIFLYLSLCHRAYLSLEIKIQDSAILLTYAIIVNLISIVWNSIAALITFFKESAWNEYATGYTKTNIKQMWKVN